MARGSSKTLVMQIALIYIRVFELFLGQYEVVPRLCAKLVFIL